MIKSFADKETEKLYSGRVSRRLPQDIQRRALNKLRMLNISVNLDDLRTPPSNHLEALSGNRRGQHSIRINNQWRICFVWKDGDAHEVSITDYH